MMNNVVICCSVGAKNQFCAIITDLIPDLHVVNTAQCFPFYTYKRIEANMQTDIFGNELDEKRKSPCGKYWIRDGISNAGLNHFQSIYDEKISKEDLFYYIYGLLQSEEYKTRYADNLSKELPRIPRMRKMAVLVNRNRTPC